MPGLSVEDLLNMIGEQNRGFRKQFLHVSTRSTRLKSFRVFSVFRG